MQSRRNAVFVFAFVCLCLGGASQRAALAFRGFPPPGSSPRLLG
jgi:hypothetical protein